MITRTSGSMLLFVVASMFVAGCSETSTSSRELSTPTYLFYSTVDTGGAGNMGLVAVDPDAPATPIVVAAPATLNSVAPAYVLGGTVSGTTINDLHYRYIVYGSGTTPGTGILFRLGARKSDGLFSAQISSESAAADICPDLGVWGASWGSTSKSTFAYPDYVNPLNSVYVYLKDTGGTNNCLPPESGTPSGSLTAVPYVVRLNHDTATAPYTTAAANAQYPVAPVYNSDGSLNSILFWTSNGGGLFSRRTIDATLTSVQSLGTSATKPVVLGIGPAGQVLLNVNGTLGQFDPTTNVLSNLGSIAGISNFTTSDDNAFYFHTASTIYRVPYSATASSQVTTVATESSGYIAAGWALNIFGWNKVPVNDIAVSGNKVVYSLYDNINKVVNIRSVSASGGTPTTIYSYAYDNGVTVPGDTNLYAMRAAAGRIYLSSAGQTGTLDAVSVADGGGSAVVYPFSRWVGFTYYPSTRLFGDYDGLGTNMRPKSMFRIDYDLTTGQQRLSSYDADTTATLVDFGTIAPSFSMFLMTQRPDMLGITTNERTLFAYNNNNGGQDIAFLHARDASSVRQITLNDTTSKMLTGMSNIGGGCALGDGDFDPLLPLLTLLALGYLLRHRLPSLVRRGGEVALLFVALGLAALPAYEAKAEDVVIVPGVGLGESGMDFTRSTGENDQATFNVIEVSLTAAYNGLYLRGSAELPLGETYSHGPALVRQFKREDASVTLGWHPFQTFSFSSSSLNNALGGLSIFTGYSSGKTSIVTYDGGSGLPPYAVYTEYLDKGMYYGMGYSQRIGEYGSLSLNVAQASMDGSLIVEPSALGAVVTTETGTTQGLSYGLSWAGSLRDKATYYVSFRQRSYTTELVTFSVDKQFRIISAGFIFPM